MLKPIGDLLDNITVKMQKGYVKQYKDGVEKAKTPFLYRKFGKKWGFGEEELGIPYEERGEYSKGARGNFDFGYTLGKLPHSIYKFIYKTEKPIKDNDLVIMFTYAKNLLQAKHTEYNIYNSLMDSIALPPYLRIVCRDISNKISKGIATATAMEDYYSNLFPTSVIYRLKLAAETASQEKVYNELKLYYEEKIKRRKQIRKLLMYPSVVAILLLVIVLGFNFYLLPQYTETLSDPTQLPASFKRLQTLAEFLINPIKLSLLFIVISSLKKYFTKTTSGRRISAMVMLSLPGLNNFFILLNVQAWFRELDSLINSGLTEVQAVSKASVVITNELIRNTIEEEYSRMVKNSASFSDCSNNIPFYSTEVMSLIKIGSETSRVGENIHAINRRVSDSLDDLFDTISELMTPIIILVVGGFILTMLLPVFNDITNGTGVV